MMAVDQFFDHRCGARELGRQRGADDAMSCDRFAIERRHDPLGRVDVLAGERFEASEQGGGGVSHKKASTYMRKRFATNIATAVGHCILMTPFASRNCNRAAGTILKFAAIGVSNVPQ